MTPRRNAPRRDRRYSPGATPSGQEPTAYRWAGGDWGLVQWEQTIGDLLSSAGYCCAAYGKWHVGEGRGRWPTDKGFTEWYGPPRTYDEALWPTDPWYDPGRDPVSKMLSIKRGEADVTEGEQLTLDVRRDCDNEYLAKADRFIRAAVDDDTPFFVYFNHSLMQSLTVGDDDIALFTRISGDRSSAVCPTTGVMRIELGAIDILLIRAGGSVMRRERCHCRAPARRSTR